MPRKLGNFACHTGVRTPDLSRNADLSRPSFTTGMPVMGLFG